MSPDGVLAHADGDVALGAVHRLGIDDLRALGRARSRCVLPLLLLPPRVCRRRSRRPTPPQQRGAAEPTRRLPIHLTCGPSSIAVSVARMRPWSSYPYVAARATAGRGRGAPLDECELHPADFERVSPDIARSSRSAPRAPLSSSGCAIVVSAGVTGRLHVVEADDRELARAPARRPPAAASSTPIAWTSELAKTAVGGSVRASSSAAAARAASRPCGRRNDPLRRDRDPGGGAAPPRSPRAGGRWSRTRTGSPPRRRRRRSARWPSASRCSAAIRPPSTSSIVMQGSVSCERSSSTTGMPAASSRRASRSVGASEIASSAVDAAARREASGRARSAARRAPRRAGSAGSPSPASLCETPRRRSITEGWVKNGATTPIACVRPVERARAAGLGW